MPGAKNRLSDIDVDEVSGVDRAANKRRFIIAKSEDGMDGEEQQAGGAAGAATEDGQQAGAEGGAQVEGTQKGDQGGGATGGESGAAAAQAGATEGGTDGAAAAAGQAQTQKNDGDGSAQGAAPTEGAPASTAKADLPVHLALLNEKKAALVAAADKLIGSIDALDIGEALDSLDSMSTLVWRMRDDFAVVKLAKSEEGTERDGVVADLQKAHARLQAKKALVEAKKAAAGDQGGAEPTPAPEQAAAGGAAGSAVLKAIADHLGTIAAGIEKALRPAAPAPTPAPTTKAEDVVAKADFDRLVANVTDMAKRLVAVEKSAPTPQSSEAGGGGSGSGSGSGRVNKGETAWPQDLAAKK